MHAVKHAKRAMFLKVVWTEWKRESAQRNVEPRQCKEAIVSTDMVLISCDVLEAIAFHSTMLLRASVRGLVKLGRMDHLENMAKRAHSAAHSGYLRGTFGVVKSNLVESRGQGNLPCER